MVMNEGNMFRFDLWLYNEMKKRNWDSLDLEVESGISRASINLYIKGRQYPTFYSFAKIIAALGKHIEIVDN